MASADRIPKRLFEGERLWVEASFLHPDSIKSRDCREGEVVVSVDGNFRWMHRDALARLGVALLCVLLSGCQFVIYQHNDHRQTPATPPQTNGTGPSRSANVFPGMFGLSPGLNSLADAWSVSGNGRVWAGHSAGGQRIADLLPKASLATAPDTVVLVEPWPLRLDLSNAPASVKRIVVVSARPCEVVPPPGVAVEYRRRPLAMAPIDLTFGHLVACGWVEAMP